MKQFILKHKKSIAGIATCLLIGGVTMSFQNTEFGPLQKIDMPLILQDSVPGKGETNDEKMSMKDYDKMLSELNNELEKSKEALGNIDFDKIRAEVEASMSKIDFEKMKLDIDKAMKEVDLAKIEKEIAFAMKKTDWKKMDAEMKASLEAARKEISKVNMEEVKKELEQAKAEVEKSKTEMKKLDMNKVMEEAKESIKKATEELKQRKIMFDEMEKDGLINQKDGFTIELKNKSLFINGKKQNEAVTEKYRKLTGTNDFRITIDKD